MKVEQIYTGCLAQGAYYITSMGEAAIIDPLREITPYLERLKRDGVKLKYILETHFHADFVSGHLDLSRATGAPIVYGPTAKPRFDAIVAEDNQIFELGKCKDPSASYTRTYDGKLLLPAYRRKRTRDGSLQWRHALPRRCRPS